MVDLLNPLGEYDAWGTATQRLQEEVIKDAVEISGGVASVSAGAAQSLVDLRAALAAQLAALDDYIDEVEPEYDSVGGLPTPSDELATGLSPDDPDLQYLLEKPSDYDEKDERGRYSDYEEAVAYIRRARNSTIFRIFYEYGEWVVFFALYYL